MSSGFFILYLQFAAALPSRLFIVLLGLLCLALFGFVWLCLLCLLCFKYLLCFARKYLKGSLLFEYYRISAMQIIGSGQIVTYVTSLVPTFFSCIALFCICYFCFSFFVLLALLDCAGVFRSCGSDEDAVPRPCKPLKRLDRNFYMGVLLLLLGSAGFVLCCRRVCHLWVRTFLGASK